MMMRFLIVAHLITGCIYIVWLAEVRSREELAKCFVPIWSGRFLFLVPGPHA